MYVTRWFDKCDFVSKDHLNLLFTNRYVRVFVIAYYISFKNKKDLIPKCCLFDFSPEYFESFSFFSLAVNCWIDLFIFFTPTHFHPSKNLFPKGC